MSTRLVFYKFIFLFALIALFIPALSQQVSKKTFDLYIGENDLNNYSINEIIANNYLNKKIPNGLVNKGTLNYPLYLKIIINKTNISENLFLVVSNPILDQVVQTLQLLLMNKTELLHNLDNILHHL